MKGMSDLSKSVALLTLVLSALGGLKNPAAAVVPMLPGHSNLQLAEGLVGQCRAAKERAFVYSQRSTGSQTLRTLAPNERVTLADNGSGGWIAISSPEKGYVQVEELTMCPGGTNSKPKPAPSGKNPTTTSSLCRIVTYKQPEGLAIRNQPDHNAPRVGGVYPGNRVTLRTSPPPITKDKDGRSWVEVTAPTRGWISYGYPPTSTNLGLCP
jgi:hypothetical protein